VRLVFAIITFVAAAILLAVGIVVRTAPDPALKYDYAVETTGSAPLTIVDGVTLNALDGRQTMTVRGDGQIVAAYARRADVLAWVGDASYNEIAFRDEHGDACAPDPEQAGGCALESIRHRGSEDVVPDPYGADIWIEDFQDEASLRMTETIPSDLTYVIASDGSGPAPSEVEIVWPTPPAASREISAWLIIGGSVLGVVGLVLLLSAIYRMRNKGGPRRRMPKVPKRPMIKTVRSPRVAARAGAGMVALAITAVAFFGKSFWLLVLIVGFAGWERYARLTRGLVLDAETAGYANAVRVLGGSSWRIYLRHILPNIVSALIVQMTINFPEIILLETGLSFLGLGVQPPLTSLGLLVSESRNYIALAWWMAAVPGAVIVLTTLSISLIGDWLRDMADSRLR